MDKAEAETVGRLIRKSKRSGSKAEVQGANHNASGCSWIDR